MRDHGDEARRADAPKLEDVAGTANTANVGPGGGDAVRPMSEDERETVRTVGAPAGAAAGAAAGATAGLVTPLGPIGAGIGAVLGAVAGALAGGMGAAQAADDATWADEEERHYRALYEGRQQRLADVGYDRVRGAYQYGHLAARHPDFAGRDFPDVEPELQRRWRDDLRASVGDWETVRVHVHDAYGHARAEGAGVRRDAGVIGSAGSAVDPVELREERAASRSLGGTGTHDRASFADPVPGEPGLGAGD